jgi:hypothetical protein
MLFRKENNKKNIMSRHHPFSKKKTRKKLNLKEKKKMKIQWPFQAQVSRNDQQTGTLIRALY